MDAAGAAGADVVAVPRSRVFAGSAAEDVVVIEIADDVIAVTAGDSTALLPRSCDPARVSNAAPDGPRVIIDAPAGVTGVDEAATRILAALLSGGRAAEIVPIGAAVAATQPVSTPEVTRRSRFRPAVVGGCGGGGDVRGGRRDGAPAAVDCRGPIRRDHRTRRGPHHGQSPGALERHPGDRRPGLQTGSGHGRGDHYAALHITQSYVPGESLGATAELLQRELDRQPRACSPTSGHATSARVAPWSATGRCAAPARSAGWCWSTAPPESPSAARAPRGVPDTVDEACDGAVRSAREITGTAAQR